MRELKRRAGRDGDLPPVLLVHLGSVEDGDRFLSRHWPEARAVSDESRFLFDAFGREKGSARELFGLRVWWAALKAFLGGSFVGKPVGDTRRMPGAYLVSRSGEILLAHDAEHAGDHPDLDAVARAAAAA